MHQKVDVEGRPQGDVPTGAISLPVREADLTCDYYLLKVCRKQSRMAAKEALLKEVAKMLPTTIPKKKNGLPTVLFHILVWVAHGENLIRGKFLNKFQSVDIIRNLLPEKIEYRHINGARDYLTKLVSDLVHRAKVWSGQQSEVDAVSD